MNKTGSRPLRGRATLFPILVRWWRTGMRVLILVFGQGQRYAVYHARDPRLMLEPREDRWLLDPSLHYLHVADVKAPLDRVFALTNHVSDQSWPSQKEVLWVPCGVPLFSARKRMGGG